MQTWYQQTDYRGDASRPSKQESLYFQFFTLPASTQGDFPVNTVGQGKSDSLGVRLLRTIGDTDAVQLTTGADWRRSEQFYRETSLNPAGEIVLSGGDVYGIPKSRLDDYGLLGDLQMPCSDRVSFNVGGRLDYCHAALDAQDPVVVQFTDPTQYYYSPGFNEPHDVLGMAYLTGKTKLTEQCTCQAGVAYAMRMPDLAELYSDDPFVPLARFGNSYVSGFSELSPEKDLQIDLGITVTKREGFLRRARVLCHDLGLYRAGPGLYRSLRAAGSGDALPRPEFPVLPGHLADRPGHQCHERRHQSGRLRVRQ